MGRPVNANGERTRQAILEAGLQTFAEKGYFGSSLRDIAKRVGVRDSALYNYFSSKEALFHAILDAAEETKNEEWAAFLAEPMRDARSVLERLTTRILEIFCEPRRQYLFLLMMSDGMRLAKQGDVDLIGRMTSGAAPFKGLIQRFISEGSLRPGDPDVLTMVFMGPLTVWRQIHALDPASSVIANREQFVRDHVDHFLRGAGPAAARRVSPKPRTAAPRKARSSTRRSRVRPRNHS